MKGSTATKEGVRKPAFGVWGDAYDHHLTAYTAKCFSEKADKFLDTYEEVTGDITIEELEEYGDMLSDFVLLNEPTREEFADTIGVSPKDVIAFEKGAYPDQRSTRAIIVKRLRNHMDEYADKYKI